MMLIVTIVLAALFVVGKMYGDKEKAKNAGRLFYLKRKKEKE